MDETFDHQLRTPLAVLLGHLELIHEQAACLPADVAASLQVMERAGRRLEAAVEAVCLVTPPAVPHQALA